jgi:hypothetical protein
MPQSDDYLHPFDEWDKEERQSQQKFLEQALRDSSLVFQVFSTESGQALLDRWIKVLIWSPTASKDDNDITIGMNEGYKSFIRSILNAINTHEKQL